MLQLGDQRAALNAEDSSPHFRNIALGENNENNAAFSITLLALLLCQVRSGMRSGPAILYSFQSLDSESKTWTVRVYS